MDPSILVVGNQLLHNLISKLLSNVHNWVVTNVTVSDAEPIISAQQPDILLLQVSDLNALSLAQRLQQQSRLVRMYQVFVGYSSSEQSWLADSHIAHALEQGADGYFCTPTLLELEESMANGDKELFETKQRLLEALISSGLKRVHKDRELLRANYLLSSIALSDPLTELNNRRAFDWELPRQIDIARARRMPISLLMLDIDFFKRINDQHGHIVGDQALRMVANRLQNNLRSFDTPFRYGGEEFSIILNNTAIEKATQIGKRICHLIADQPFTINASLQLDITLSIGTASLQDCDDAKGFSLLHRADQNLLTAKKNGRNLLVSGLEHLNEGDNLCSRTHPSEDASPVTCMLQIKHSIN